MENLCIIANCINPFVAMGVWTVMAIWLYFVGRHDQRIAHAREANQQAQIVRDAIRMMEYRECAQVGDAIKNLRIRESHGEDITLP